MAETAQILEYKCPNCGAGLPFNEDNQKMTCQYCDTEFDLEDVLSFNDKLAEEEKETIDWEEQTQTNWSEEESGNLRIFSCPSCSGELLTDDMTAATFCPYCGNPTILPGRLSGGLKPDGVIPFKLSKDDAKEAFLRLCKGKPLLPKFFAQEQQVEKITGMYVPFWLYDCDGDFYGSYRATRVRHWADSRYNYTKTSYFHVVRRASAEFDRIPMDGSSKMDDSLMESIEPYDYSQMVDFETAYLSGFLADKYDVEAKAGEGRIRQRVSASMDELISPSLMGYTSVIPKVKKVNIHQSKAKYVLLPVWMLTTRYQGKTYTFAMNGQTGRMTGELPICGKRSWAWFGGIAAGVAALALGIMALCI